MRKKRTIIFILVSLLFVIIIICGLLFIPAFDLLFPKKYFTAEDFSITTITSSVDFNQMDDYTDILLGARIDAENHPTYDGSYVDGGYPPDNIGVCTDVVWRAFKNAGYSL